MTELERKIPFSGIDPKGKMKFGVLLEMFQEMADADASKYNLSVRQTLSQGVTWVLRKYRVDLRKYPTWEDGSLKIKTYAEPCRNIYSLRSYLVNGLEGDFIGAAYTWWVLFDIKRQRPLRLDKSAITADFKEIFTEEPPREPSVPEVTSGDVEDVWKVRWEDLDVNDHTNHAVFFSWALDTVPDGVNGKLAPMLVESEFIHAIPRTRVRCITQELPCSSGRKFLHSLRLEDCGTECARLSSFWS